MTDERRAAKRVTFFAEAELEGMDASHDTVRLADISVAGVFVDVRTVYPPGTTARLRFSVLGHEIDVLADVRYSMPSFGMGMRFLNLRPEDRRVIEDFVARAS
jgi:hypothetical protein